MKVLICQEIEVLRVGLTCLLQSFEGVEVVASAATELELLQELRREVDVILLHFELPDCDISAVVRRIRQQKPAVVIVIMLKTAHSFWFALNTKADGYCHTETDVEHLQTALKVVSSRRAYLDPFVSDYLLRGEGYAQLRSCRPSRENNSKCERLSRRENEVLQLLAEGMSNSELAEELGLSTHTVKVHIKKILAKLNVKDRTNAVLMALQSQ